MFVRGVRVSRVKHRLAARSRNSAFRRLMSYYRVTGPDQRRVAGHTWAVLLSDLPLTQNNIHAPISQGAINIIAICFASSSPSILVGEHQGNRSPSKKRGQHESGTVMVFILISWCVYRFFCATLRFHRFPYPRNLHLTQLVGLLAHIRCRTCRHHRHLYRAGHSVRRMSEKTLAQVYRNLRAPSWSISKNRGWYFRFSHGLQIHCFFASRCLFMIIPTDVLRYFGKSHRLPCHDLPGPILVSSGISRLRGGFRRDLGWLGEHRNVLLEWSIKTGFRRNAGLTIGFSSPHPASSPAIASINLIVILI